MPSITEQIESSDAMKAAVGTLDRMRHLAHEARVVQTKARDGIDEGVRAAKKLTRQVRSAAVDAKDDLTYRVKRQPLVGVGLAFAAGTVFGIGLSLVGRLASKSCREAAA